MIAILLIFTNDSLSISSSNLMTIREVSLTIMRVIKTIRHHLSILKYSDPLFLQLLLLDLLFRHLLGLFDFALVLYLV